LVIKENSVFPGRIRYTSEGLALILVINSNPSTYIGERASGCILGGVLPQI